jgi:signal transduction histidine kinase
MDQGRYDDAEMHFLAELEISKESEDMAGMALAYNHLGKLYIQSGDFQKAGTFLKESLDISRRLELKKGIQNNLKDLYQLDSAEGRFALALENYKSFTIYSDSLLSEETNQKVSRMKIEYETEKKDQEIELLNKDNEIKTLQLSKQKAVRHGMIAGIVLLLITGFLLFRSFRLRKKLEQQQAIINERKRISADLHDDVGSGLSRIMLLTELVKNEAKTPETRKEAEKIAAISKELSANISEIIWALNANNDNLESLVAYIRRYAAEFFDDSAVNIKITSTGEITGIPISGELRREIFYTVKEALHNIYKHSQATEAKLAFAIKDELLTIVIQDNGVGIPENETGRYGNGLTNMQQRMEAVGGHIRIENHEGTKITLEVPVR